MHSDVNGLKGFGLRNFNQFFATEFKHGEKMDHQSGNTHFHIKQVFKPDESASFLEHTQDDAHVFAYRQLFPADPVILVQAGLPHNDHPRVFSTSVSTQKNSRSACGS